MLVYGGRADIQWASRAPSPYPYLWSLPMRTLNSVEDIDVDVDLLRASSHASFCEWKGVASYWDVVVPDAPVVAQAAWSYPSPTPAFEPIRDHLAFYAQRVDACWVGDELVQPNEGSFYGGWITARVVGPFKGGPGTAGW